MSYADEIKKRRDAIRARLDEHGELSRKMRKEIKEMFRCDSSTVCNDLVAIRRNGSRDNPHSTPAMRKYIFERDNYICQYCGEFCQYPVAEHIRPQLQGGMATPSNLVTACNPCNSKLARKSEEYKRSLLISAKRDSEIIHKSV